MIVLRLLLLLVVLMPALPAEAAEGDGSGINLQISPLPIELSAPPGTTASAELRVRNAGTQTEQLKVTLKKFRMDDQGVVKIEDRGPEDDYFDWVSFSRPTFSAPPDQWQTVKMTINVPKTAAFGYYYVVEFARANPAKGTPGKSAIEGAVGIFVLLDAKVAGAKREASITQFTADHQFYEFLPTKFAIHVANSGNVHLKPHGNIFVQGPGGRAIATLNVNATSGNVLPHSFRTFSTEWSDGFPVYRPKRDDSGQPVLDKSGRPVTELTWDFNNSLSKLRFGKYTAKLVMVYDNGQRDVPLEGTVSFWVIPWRLLLGAVLLLALPFFFGYKYVQTRRQLKRLTREKPS
jgi:hypothetical protein